MVGEVPAEFRSLPAEVLETVLVHHQKSISLRDGSGRIGRFAAITNGDGAAAPEIVRGMERVVVARLRDAAFFLAEDRKSALGDRVPDLAGVTFHQGLGSYRDKSARMERLVEAMGRQGLLGGDALAAAKQAARLAKADLVTFMVREFPELQGVMGGIYLAGRGRAGRGGRRGALALPPGRGRAGGGARGRLRRRRREGARLRRRRPRRQARHPRRLLRPRREPDRQPRPLRPAARRPGRGARGARLLAAEAGREGPRPAGPARGRRAGLRPPRSSRRTWRHGTPGGFLLDRLEYVLGARGFSADEVSAVVTAPDAGEGARPRRTPRSPAGSGHSPTRSTPGAAWRRCSACRREVPEDFAALAEAFKRAKNILAQQAPAAAVDPKLFEVDAERALFEAASGLEQAAGSYEDRLRGLASLRAPVGRFFDDVLVMAEDARVRANRLALLNLTLSLFYRIADISSLGGTS